MKATEYFLNLLYTGLFLYSVVKVADGTGYIWLFCLVVSTIVLTVIFLTNCYSVAKRKE